MAERRFLVRAGLRRNYGKHEIYYELSEEITAQSTGEVKDAFLNLQSLLENQVTVYEAVSLQHVQLPTGAAPQQTQDSKSDSFTLETLKVEFHDNKRRVRACGGKYLKWGVPVYEDCGTDLGIEALSFGVHDMRNLKLTVQVDIENGKPVRARSIS